MSIHSPASPDSVALPSAAAPGTLPTVVTISDAQIARRDFNRGFLDRQDPLEGAGIPLHAFEFAASYPVKRALQPDLLNRLHANVYTRVRDGNVADAAAELVEFKDVKTGQREAARRYVVIQSETARGTRMSVFTTFLTYGDNLYLAVNSFILPPISWWTTLFALAGTAVLLLTSLQGGILGLLLYALILGFFFRDVLRDLSQGEPLDLALRKKFPKRGKYSTFNTDDMLMFFKSTLPLVLTSVQEVFEQAGVPVDVLERAIQNVNMVTNIDTRGGAVNAINSVLGGMGNRVSGGAARAA